MQVFVQDPNNISVDVDPAINNIVIEVNQGRQGRGIENISYTEISGQYYLVVTYTDGTTETLGPLVVTGGAAFLLGGTAGALPYQSAPNTTTFLPIGTANQVVVAGASAPQYTSNLTGLTVNNTPVGNTTPSTGAFTNLSASGTFALTGDQVQISEGGTGQTTANAAFNALAPSQTGNAGKYLKTDGTNSAWDQLDISTADITGTLPIANGGTGQTTANSALNALLPTQSAQSGKYLKTDGTNASWDQLDISTADITGVLAITNGGTGASTAPGARANLSAAVLGTNNDITSMTGVTGGISSPDFVQFDTTAAATNAVGKVYWDAAQGTLDVGLLGGNVITRIGQTLVAFVTNAEAVTITKGQVVYLFGAQGDRATVKLAYNTSDATSAKTFGVVAENIGPNQTGFVMCQGVLEGLNLGAFTAGNTLYLGATPGSLTATKPAAPNHLVYVGLVERANPGNGQLYVKVQNGYELNEIHDVQIINPQNGQTIIYDATTSLWKNANLTAGSGISVTNGAASITVSNTGVLSFSGGTTGLTPATSTTGAVTLGGTLNVANGGTGATTASGARTNLGLGTISTQNANSVTITGGTVNNTSVGASTPSTGAFTSVAMTSGTVSTTPASATDIANKQYVDTLVSSGITYHAPVKYEVPSTTGNLTATYNNGTAGVGATLTNAGTLTAFTPDGVVAQAGDRILIYNQTNAAQNGVYVVTTVGSGSVAWVLTRASDADTYALKSPNSLGEGDAFFIQSGNTGAGETYVCNTQGTITFGTTPITFVQVSASQVYSAGTGLTLSGTQFSITNTAVTPNSYGSASAVGTFTVNQQGQLTLAATTPIAITNTQVSGLGTMSTQNANSVAITGGSVDGTTIGGTTRAAGSFTTLTLTNALGIANGGTGQTTANAAFNALAPSQTGNAGKYLTTDGTNTSWATNPLGTVTSVDVSGGTTGLTTSGGPITSSGTITLGGTLATTNGGTGLTSFTANGLVYASSTSALTTGSALTFDGTNFATTGTASATKFIATGGTATGNGMYLPAANTLAFSTNGAERIRVDSSGLVGIGTSSPTRQLDVSGAGQNIARFTSSGASTSLGLDNTNANAWGSNISFATGGTISGYFGTIGGILGNTTQDLAAYANTGNGFRVYTNGNNLRASIDSSGNFTLNTGTFTYSAGTANGVAYLNASKVLTTGSALTFNGTTLTLPSGNISIGSSTAGTTLDVFNGDAVNAQRLRLTTSGTDGVIQVTRTSGTVPNLIFRQDASELMRLTSTGLGIGTSSPVSRLTISGTSTGAWLTINRTDSGTNLVDFTASGSRLGYIGYSGNTLNILQSQADSIVFSTSNTARATLDSSGNFGLGATSPLFRFDARGASGTGISYIETTTGNTNRIQLGATTGAGYINATAGSGSPVLQLQVADSTRATLDSSGNLGIGTSSPAVKLVVSNAGANGYEFDPVNSFISSYNRSTNAWTAVTFRAGSYIWNINNSNDALRLDASGNLGLGVTPSAWRNIFNAFQVGYTGSVFALTVSNATEQINVASNLYQDSAGNDLRIQAGFATRYRQASGAHIWSTAASSTAGSAISFTQAMTLDADGDLGIGTTSPAYKLDVNGAGRFGATASVSLYFNSNLRHTNNAGSALYLDVCQGGAAGDFIIRNSSSFTTQLTLSSGGNLGLGVTPSAWSSSHKALQLPSIGIMSGLNANSSANYFNNSFFNGTNFIYSGTGAAARYEQAAGVHAWYNAASGTAGNTISFTQAMTLDASGNLLIGRTSGTGANLDVYESASNDATIRIGNVQNAAVTAIGKQGASSYGATSAADAFLYSDGPLSIMSDNASGVIKFSAGGNTERARITSGGNLLVGTTSNSRAARLRVEGIETAHLTGYGNGFGIGIWMTPNASASGGTATPMSFQNVSDTTVGTITTTASATAYNTSSDYRLKDNPQPLTGSGAFIDALKPKTWNWKSDGSKGVGFIAHEVQEVSPGSVTGEKDGEQMQAMEYGSAEFIANIIAELQSLRARVAQLEAK